MNHGMIPGWITLGMTPAEILDRATLVHICDESCGNSDHAERFARLKIACQAAIADPTFPHGAAF